NPSAAAAEAEAAVVAAETGGLRMPGASSGGQQSSHALERDDANSTPVPQEQAAIDSFGTTPVGSMPSNLAHFSSLAAGISEGDAAAVLQQHGSESMQVSSPASTDNHNANGEAASGAQPGAACHPAVGAPSQTGAAQTDSRAAPSGNSEA
ncbi:hypothetical protein EC988_010174, partial [Linderina pennispora]